MKTCSKCKLEKTVSEFYKDPRHRDGLQSQCNGCVSVHKAKQYPGNKTEVRQQQAEYYITLKGYLRHIFKGMRRRCTNPKASNYKWYGQCGIRVCFESFNEFHDYVVNELKIDPRGLQIDRIDNEGNYEKGNIRWVTAKENCQNRGGKNELVRQSTPVD